MNKKIIIISSIVFVIGLIIITMIIPAYLHTQSDYLGLILYNCAFGFERNGALMLLTYDNGTHTIDEDSCKWKLNKN